MVTTQGSMTMDLPRILFFNINGSGMGHMNRCLSYARPLRGKAEVTFFSLASAVEIIEDMGFDAEYYVSQFWSTNSNYIWNTELAFRLSMVLEHVQPQVIVFDGTWPYQGFLGACKTYGKAKLVWSKRGLFKDGVQKTPVNEQLFDLILEPGELVENLVEASKPLKNTTSKLKLAPVTLLREDEILDKASARQELGLCLSTKYALLSLGPGNLRDVNDLGHKCIAILQELGYTVVVACAPISVNDISLPQGVLPLSVYPLVRVMRAFDVFMGAAGYNTCCEVVQTQIPTVLLPNTLLADDQTRRAHLVAKNSPTVVCLSEKKKDLQKALDDVLNLQWTLQSTLQNTLHMGGAEEAAMALLGLSKNSMPKQPATLPKHIWNTGPPWKFILKYTCVSTMLQYRFWHKIFYPYLNLWGIRKIMRPSGWQVDLKHALSSERKKTLLLWSEGLCKEEQRRLCQNVQEYLQEYSEYIPVLVTDMSDFAYFSRLHWLVEYLPKLRMQSDANYKEQKRAYLLWRYGGEKVLLQHIAAKKY